VPQEFRQSFERGLPISDMQQQPQPAGDGKASGTTVRFLYDKTIFTPGWALRLVPPSSSCIAGRKFCDVLVDYTCVGSPNRSSAAMQGDF
jgi:hypothetical protein